MIQLLRGGARLVIATPEGLAAAAPGRADFSARTVRFRAGHARERALGFDTVPERLR